MARTGQSNRGNSNGDSEYPELVRIDQLWQAGDALTCREIALRWGYDVSHVARRLRQALPVNRGRPARYDRASVLSFVLGIDS